MVDFYELIFINVKLYFNIFFCMDDRNVEPALLLTLNLVMSERLDFFYFC
jgi:hypothetical protein